MTSIFKEHKRQLKQILILAKTDLKKTYRGSFIGTGWAVIKPAFTLFVYWFAFDMGIRQGKEINGHSFFIFILPAFVAWFFMNDATLSGAASIRQNSQYVKKMAFPVSTIMTFNNLAKLYVHFMLSVIMYAILLLSGYYPTIYHLQFLFYCPFMFLFFLVLTWSTAPMSAFSKDFQNLLNSVMMGVFWLSGVVYDTSAIKLQWVKVIIYLNPFDFFITGYRNTFIDNKWFFDNPIRLCVILCEFLVLALLGAYNYKRLRKTLPDVL